MSAAVPTNQFMSIEAFFDNLRDNTACTVDALHYVPQDGVMVQHKPHSSQQQHTSDVYEHMWEQSKILWNEDTTDHNRETLLREYPDAYRYIDGLPTDATVVDLGCGSGFSAHALFGDRLKRYRYFGVEISDGIFAAKYNMDKQGVKAAFLKGDIAHLPFADGQADFILCTGVLQHTDSVAASIASLAKLLKPGAISFVNCYKKAPPVRAFCDNYINQKVKDLPTDEINKALEPLTRFGIALGHNDAKIEVPLDVPMLGLKQGTYPVQQFFFDYVFKAYFHSHLDESYMAMLNYDWYSPKNCHQVSEAELTNLLTQNNLRILNVKETGTFISTIVTR